MKKKELNKDFNAIQIEEGDDVFFIAETMNKDIYKDEEGNLYCVDYFLSRVAFFDIKENEWKPSSKDKMDELDNYHKLDDEEAMKVFKENPPFDSFKEMEKKRAKELSKYYLELRKKTPHKVIGWLDHTHGRKQANDQKDLYFAALLNDICENRYDFSGDEMYLFPVFEDGTYLDFSSRGWGGVMAASKDEFEDLSYSVYAFMYKGKKYPDLGFYKKEKISIKISTHEMDEIKKYIDNFYELDYDTSRDWYGANYLYDITDLHFDIPDIIGEVEFISDNGKAIYKVSEVVFLENEKELNNLIEYYNEDNTFSLPEMVVGDIDLLIEKLRKEKRVVLVIRNM